MDEEREKQYLTLNGNWAAASRIVGYCRLHKVHLTAAQVKEKDCLKKRCRALKRWEGPYWEKRKKRKEIRQKKKEKGIPPWERVEIRTDRNGELLPTKKKR